MASLEELRKTRLEKLERLKKAGVNPYPSNVPRDCSVAEAITRFDELSKKTSVSLAGRVMALRPQGGLIFLNFTDGTAMFQALLKDGETPKEALELFNETVDIGDFVSLTGTLFVTKRGEKTLQVVSWTMGAKSLLPLPEKWHGITDPEERFRLRYLDLLMTPELRALFGRREKFWDITRVFMKEKGFLEVETPTLEVTTGGAEARPFKTHHNDFDLDVYLRISIGELWQKRLMAAGFPRTFEIGRAYRNEGSSLEHTQEFTNMEFYAAYMNLPEGKKLVRDMYIQIANEVFGKTE